MKHFQYDSSFNGELVSSNDDDRSRRGSILEAAERLLRHYGFAKTTVSDIARESGVGVGTVYLEFSSKDEIIGALAHDRHERLLAAIRTAVDGTGPYGKRLRDLLDARIKALFEFATEGQHGADLVSCACPAVDKIKAKYRSDEEALLAELLASAHGDGEFHVPSPERTVRVILRIYDSFAPTVMCATSLDDVTKELHETHDLILNGLRRR